MSGELAASSGKAIRASDGAVLHVRSFSESIILRLKGCLGEVEAV